MNEPTIKKEPKLTPKQSRFLKLYLDPASKTFGNGTLSALEVYDTDNYFTASAIATENLQKLRNPTKALMEAKGIDLDKLLVVLNDGLKAQKIVTSPSKGDKEVADHAVRHKYLETAARWLGTESSDQPTNQVNVQINANKFFEEDE